MGDQTQKESLLILNANLWILWYVFNVKYSINKHACIKDGWVFQICRAFTIVSSYRADRKDMPGPFIGKTCFGALIV